jgi:ATP-binding cassette subfamily F protein 3
MSMITFNTLTKSYGGRKLFDNLSFVLNKGDKCSLVGKNGTGKTTLLRLISGEEEPDNGSVVINKNYRVGVLKQHIQFSEYTVVDEACRGLPTDRSHEQYRAEKILAGLGFLEDDLYSPPENFSGGYQIRIELCKLLLSEPDCLLLDEPSNYLDVLSLRWLIRFLQEWKGEIIMVSHDREFLDEISTHTIGIHRGKMKKVTGGTEEYYTQILLEEEIHEKTRINLEKQKAHLQSFVDRFGAKATKAGQARSRTKAIARMPVLEKLASIYHLDFEFHYSPYASQKVLTATDVAFAYPDMTEPLIHDFNMLIENGDKIAIVGKNGKGKSTLLQLLAKIFEPNKGTVNIPENVRIGYFGQTNINRLDPKKTIYEEVSLSNPLLNMTQVRAICGTMMFPGDDSSKTISVLSGGEKSRVLLGKILATPCNMLLLDEPTNHLDMESVEALVTAVETFQGVVIIVTHTEWILHRIAKKIVICHEGEQELFEGNYEDFLRKVGWQEEAPPVKKPKVAKRERLKAIEQEISDLYTAIEKKKEEKPSAKVTKAIEDLNTKLEALYKEYQDLGGS